ncbi:TonB-dependent receptor plug domain-containing protein [Roseateles oligotrophus]|uniref:TonB-dependent receptor n=1 Tax=Roseateles oligotrophus TaxID=1769250 RepID=A0ABT2YAC8_9BURK|nr:TonB-dependent receptor [Roseateles oligotrophus]MCV2367233.1 TonB-dependent receptor [Roseateles oligotrophus]
MNKLLVALAFFLYASAQAQTQAQTPPTPTASAASAPKPAAPAASAPTAELPRVVLSGSADSDDDGARRNESIAKTIYGREELDRQGDIDVTDVLKRLPGVSMDGGAPRLRGLGGGYTQVLVNGEPAPPGFSLDSLSPADVARIEIIKGATAEYAGVAGTINVVLREPPRSQQREVRSNLSYRAVEPGGGMSFQWGDRLGAVSFVLPLSVAHTAQSGEYTSARISRNRDGEVQSQSISGQDVSRNSNGQFSPRLQWKFSDVDTLNLGGFVQHNQSGNHGERQTTTLLGAPLSTLSDESHTRSDGDVLRLNLQWQRRLQDGAKLELKSSWQNTQRNSFNDYAGRRVDGSLIERETRSEFEETRAALGGRWTQPIAQDHTLLSGWDVERRQREDLRRIWDAGVERLDSATGLPFEASIDRTALFMQDEWAINKSWAMLPGLRFEQVKSHSHDPGRNGAGAYDIDNTARVMAPVLHVNYRFDQGGESKGGDQLRASITRSFKLPDLSALAGRYVLNGNYERDVSNTPIAADRAGNPNLQPELSTGFDLSFEHYPAGGGVFSVGMFYRRIEDLIRQRIALEADPAPGVVAVPRWVSRPVNLGQASSLGLELEIKGRAEEWLPALFSANSGVQLRGSWNFYRSEVDQVDGPDNRLEAQPPWLANLGFDARIKNSGWTVGASLVLQPAYATRQTDLQLSHRSAVQTLDAFASWKIDRSNQIRIGFTNLLAPDSEIANSVEDLDGFSAGSSMHRNTQPSVNASWVARF